MRADGMSRVKAFTYLRGRAMMTIGSAEFGLEWL